MTDMIPTNDLTNTSKDYIKDRLDFLDKKEQELKEVLEQGKQKEQEINDKLLDLKKRIEANLSPKERKMLRKNFRNLSVKETENVIEKEKNNPKLKKIIGKIGKAAFILLIAGLAIEGINKGGKLYAKKEHNEEIQQKINDTKKESSEKNSINIQEIQKTTTPKEVSPSVMTKTPVIMKKDITVIAKRKMEAPKKTTNDDVFTIIEQPDPKVDPKMYTSRKILSEGERDIVKNTYHQLLETGSEQAAKAIIQRLDKRTLQGLRDILVKKIVLSKKTEKDVRWLQTVAKLTVTRENEMLAMNISAANIALEVKRAQGEIMKYTIQPSGYSIQWKNEDYNEKQPGYDKIQSINFTVRKDGDEIGILPFTRKGVLKNNEITKDSKTYLITQNDKNILITEEALTSK